MVLVSLKLISYLGQFEILELVRVHAVEIAGSEDVIRVDELSESSKFVPVIFTSLTLLVPSEVEVSVVALVCSKLVFKLFTVKPSKEAVLHVSWLNVVLKIGGRVSNSKALQVELKIGGLSSSVVLEKLFDGIRNVYSSVGFP
jgi:hypothetical protein